MNKPIEARQDRLKALGLLELEFDPAEGWHYIKRGALYMDTGRSQEAWIEYAKGYEILPDDNKSSIVGHCRWRGEVYGEAGEYDIAMKYYDLASEALLFARNTQNETMVSQEMFFSSLLLSARGELYCAMGNYDAAYAYFSRYAEIYENRNQSNSPDSYSLAWAEMDAWSIYADRAGVILAKSDAGEAILPEEWKSALMDCNHAIVLHSRKYNTYFIRGRIFEKLNKLDEARVDFSKAIEISPDESAAYLLCGVVCEAQGDIDRAIDDYTRAIGLDPENENAYTLRGSLYEKIGRLEEALGDYAQAIELDPDNPEVRKDYGNLCALLTRENGDED